ncbi:MAG: SHOCT domain-containing protein [Candidatus Kaiserbacteria bacterium]|nr:SHOCT domain-containing protein [Candidatus Kaiserbacteria bacterium]
MMYYYGNFDGGFLPFHFLGFIGMLAFWALVIAGIVWLVRNASGTSNGSTTSAHGSPLDILKTRYAKGEITKEQFESMKKDIHG